MDLNRVMGIDSQTESLIHISFRMQSFLDYYLIVRMKLTKCPSKVQIKSDSE